MLRFFLLHSDFFIMDSVRACGKDHYCERRENREGVWGCGNTMMPVNS